MYGLLDFACLKTARADFHPLHLAVGQLYPHPLDVRIPPTPRTFIGMAYLMTSARAFAADLTYLGHL